MNVTSLKRGIIIQERLLERRTSYKTLKSSPARFQIVSSATEREVKQYDCCPEPYPNLQYKLVLQRQFKVTPEGIIWNPKLSQQEENKSETE